MDEIKLISQPEELKIKLYPHQLASVYRMEQLETKEIEESYNSVIKTNIGINADVAGYGKTLSMITLVLRDKMEWDMKKCYEFEHYDVQSSSNFIRIKSLQYPKLNMTLILVSPSVINQWIDEFKYTKLKLYKITNRKAINNLKETDDYDVVITVPNMINDLIVHMNEFAWKRFIFDEPGMLTVPNMKYVKAGFYWFVTATPTDIIPLNYNKRKNFMHNIFFDNFTHYNLEYAYKSIIIKNNIEFIQQSYDMPTPNYFYHKCYNPLYKSIVGLADDNITNLILSGDIISAVKELGGESKDIIIELLKKQKMNELKVIELEIDISKVKNNIERENKYIEKKNKIILQLQQINERYDELLKGDCSICFDKLESPVLEPNCHNIFCGKCILEWLKTKNNCPLCRGVIDMKKLIIEDKTYDDKKEKKKEKKQQLLTKENKCIEIIKENKIGKYIIFSAYDNTFIPIRNILNENNIKFIEIKGSSESRNTQINEYKNGNTNVMFLNSTTNSAGMNLQETTDIIIYHDNIYETTLNQMIARANRIGRDKSLNIHYLKL